MCHDDSNYAGVSISLITTMSCYTLLVRPISCH